MAITKTRGSPIRICHSRQATLHTALEADTFTQTSGFRPGKASIDTKNPTHRNTGSRLIRTESAKGRYPQTQSRTRTGLHVNRVGFPMPLESALRTQAHTNCASPQHPPQTGRSKQAPRVSTICPLKDF